MIYKWNGCQNVQLLSSVHKRTPSSYDGIETNRKSLYTNQIPRPLQVLYLCYAISWHHHTEEKDFFVLLEGYSTGNR